MMGFFFVAVPLLIADIVHWFSLQLTEQNTSRRTSSALPLRTSRFSIHPDLLPFNLVPDLQ